MRRLCRLRSQPRRRRGPPEPIPDGSAEPGKAGSGLAVSPSSKGGHLKPSTLAASTSVRVVLAAYLRRPFGPNSSTCNAHGNVNRSE